MNRENSSDQSPFSSPRSRQVQEREAAINRSTRSVLVSFLVWVGLIMIFFRPVSYQFMPIAAVLFPPFLGALAMGLKKSNKPTALGAIAGGGFVVPVFLFLISP